MANPRKWTDYVRVQAEGRDAVFSVCRECGAAVMSEPWLSLDVMPFDLHEKWHARAPEAEKPQDSDPTRKG